VKKNKGVGQELQKMAGCTPAKQTWVGSGGRPEDKGGVPAHHEAKKEETRETKVGKRCVSYAEIERRHIGCVTISVQGREERAEWKGKEERPRWPSLSLSPQEKGGTRVNR